MEPAQPKPLRRRRRWLIVAFALVLVSLVSWWYWPQGDARLTGRWSSRDNYYRMMPATYDFRPTGVATLTLSHERFSSGGQEVQHFRWWTENGLLFLQKRPASSWEGLRWDFIRLCDWVRWGVDHHKPVGRSYRVVSDAVVELEVVEYMLHGNLEFTATLTRIPE